MLYTSLIFLGGLFSPSLKNTLDKVKVVAILNCYAIFEAPLDRL